MNQPARARASFDSALTILEAKLKEHSDDHRIHSSLGIVYANLDCMADAIREGKRGVELVPVSKDAVIGPAKIEGLMRIYILTGEYDAAFDQIDYLLSTPTGVLSIGLIRLDPAFDPLRNLPRYQKLLEKYGT
jgi:serine/threonine-protein kinase